MHKTTTMGTVVLACALMLGLGVQSSHAFGVSGFGGKLGFGMPEDRDGSMIVSGHLELERPGSQFHLIPNLTYWSSEDATDVSGNLDGYYHFDREGLTTPYLGAGLGFHVVDRERSDDSDVGVGANLFGGVRFPMSRSHLFLEGRYTISEISHLGVLGGITIHI